MGVFKRFPGLTISYSFIPFLNFIKTGYPLTNRYLPAYIDFENIYYLGKLFKSWVVRNNNRYIRDQFEAK